MRPIDPANWPDPRRPRRATPPLADRLREMRADAHHSGYGPNDRQGLMVNPDEIEELLGLLGDGAEARVLNAMTDHLAICVRCGTARCEGAPHVPCPIGKPLFKALERATDPKAPSLAQELERIDQAAASGDRDDVLDAIQVDLSDALRAAGYLHIADELEIVQ